MEQPSEQPVMTTYQQPVQLTNQQGTTVPGLLKTVQVKLSVEI